MREANAGFQLAVVGAGPGGMAAATTAAELGVEVVLLDENAAIGGQIFRQPPMALGSSVPRLPDYAAEIFTRARALGVAHRPGRVVWGFADGNQLLASGPTGVERYTADHVILATGAYDLPVPMPGWTLPGVLTAGGAQTLLKAQRVRPGNRVLVAGAGPLILLLACQLLDAGAEVVAVLDVSPSSERLKAGINLLRLWPMAREGLGFLWRLARRRVPLLSGWSVVRILGDSRVTGAVVAPVDASGHPRRAGARRYEADTVCLGYGFVPSVELAAVRGCALEHAPFREGWVPRRTEALETTVSNVFAVGDCAGISGARVDLEEGRLAALEVARRMGRISDREAEQRLEAARAALGRLRPLQRYLETAYRPRPGLMELLEDSVVVCRCEDVSAGRITNEIQQGARSLQEVKSVCRVGMGYCQGRMCLPTVTGMLGAQAGLEVDAIGYPSPRPPVRPCTIDQLSEPGDMGADIEPVTANR